MKEELGFRIRHSLMQPWTNVLLRFAVRVVIGSINEVTSEFSKAVKYGMGTRLVCISWHGEHLNKFTIIVSYVYFFSSFLSLLSDKLGVLNKRFMDNNNKSNFSAIMNLLWDPNEIPINYTCDLHLRPWPHIEVNK